jgi:hypothetical protein
MNQLMLRFEAAISDGFDKLGADTRGFITQADGEPRFIEYGMLSDWRSNLGVALEVLYHVDEASSQPWSLLAPGYELRETILAVVYAMRYGEGALNRVFRQAIKRFATPERQAKWRADDGAKLSQRGRSKVDG